MKTTIDVIIAMLPIVTLFVGFLVWIIEVLIVRFYYFQAPVKIIEGSLWGIITIWSGFLVLYTGQIFGQSYRSTGLLSVLLDSVGSLLPQQDKEARALALVV